MFGDDLDDLQSQHRYRSSRDVVDGLLRPLQPL